MSKKKYRYVERKVETETDYNLYVKEMISVLKHERIKENIYVKHVKLSNHAFQRFQERVNDSLNLQQATRYVKNELKESKRIGTILSYDGRISILYVKDKVGYHMSPDLKTVVTISLYNEVNQDLIAELVAEKGLDGCDLKDEELVKLHLEKLNELEEQESIQCDYLMEIEKDISNTKSLCSDLILISDKKWKKRKFKNTISEQSYILKGEGRKLFRISCKKRVVMRSLTALM